MSYDLELYLSKPAILTPPDAGPNAQFAADPPARIEDEDLPDTYHPLIGKRRRWLIRLYIEGTPAPEALANFDTWLSDTIAQTKAVLIDEQSGTFLTATKTGPLPDTEPQDASGGELSFYLHAANWFYQTGFATMLDTIQRVLPAAMPQRYGQYEPMQGKVENDDTSAILKDFKADPDIFMRAKTPFSWIFMSVPCDVTIAKWHPNHFLKQNYLATRVEFQLRPKAFENPALLDLMKALSKDLDVFYAELRREECLVKGWFWRGLPTGTPSAICLGAPYLDLWPEARTRGVALTKDLVFLAPTRLDPTLPKPPQDLIDPENDGEPSNHSRTKYAPTFPFDIPGT
ncbi:MAG: hypothetical protein HKP54_04350 [Boseongicola sp.]|nr:hypothetical protein [Boseongicola sp.]